MRAIFIDRKLSKAERDHVMSEAGQGTQVFAGTTIPPELVEYVSNDEAVSEAEKKKINYDSLDLVVSSGNKTIEGKAVAEWLGFDDTSLWYYHKFRAYFILRNLRYRIAVLQGLAGRFGEVEVYTSENLLEEASLPENIVLVYPGQRSRPKKTYISLLPFLIILKSRWLINIFSGRKLKGPEHLVLDVSKRQAILDKASLETTKGNYVLAYLFQDLDDDFLIIDEAAQPKVGGNNRIRLTRDHLFGKGKLRRRYFGEPLLLSYLFSARLRKRGRKIISSLEDNTEFLYSRSAGDMRTLMAIYRSFRGASRYYIYKYLAYRRFFKKHAFRTISTVDENSPAIRCILDAARAEGITTIGIQHGNIHDLHPAYIYTPEDAGRNAFPDHTMVWGEHWKDFLMKKGNYSAENIAITGQIRTDIIPVLKRSPKEKASVIKGIGGEDHLVVFASQPQRDPGLRKQAAMDVMNAVKAAKDSFLVIKLHPNEQNDIEYYRQIALDCGLDRILITPDVDLYLLISVCDALITCFSTVGTETVYFHKPLLILDHLKQDIQHYVKEGVALQASNEEELTLQLKKVLHPSFRVDMDAYERFIRKYAFAVDGKAVERALEFIRDA